MNRICCFKNCENTSMNRKDCCFFEFPVDFNLCLQWIETVGNKDFFEDFAYGGAVPFRKKYICSDHFGDDDFVNSGNIFAGIKPIAVPSSNPMKENVLVTGPLEKVLVKQEPPEKEFWDAGDSSQVVFPIELLEHVKVEEVSSQSINLGGIDPLQGTEFVKLRRSLRTKKAEAMAIKRARETPDQRTKRRRQNALRNSIRRSMESPIERDRRRKKNAERAAMRRQNETPEQKEIRRMKDLLRARRRRLLETEEQATMRRINDAARAQARRQNESEQEKNMRRLSDLIRITNRRKNESPEERRERLRKNREYSAKKRYIQKLEFELNHPKNLIDDTCLTLRNFEEDVTAVNMSFFQSLGVYQKQHEYHYDRDEGQDKNDSSMKFIPLTNSFNAYAAQEYFQLHKVSCENDDSIKKSPEVEPSTNEANVESQLVLL
ncbi:hypothetical protein HHI36_013407 [Cryptolaemus montrouzieri]|uniref:THAP-type domain-containing protein n=1 Tax=Cryptolaemus montrouzieri TaxID=559131 RepID=A0ABD2NHB5_9CUCU